MKKHLRVALITLAVIAAIILGYVIMYMQPQPLLDCMKGTEPPNAGTIVCHQQGENGESVPTTLTVTSKEQVAALWESIQTTQVRFNRGMAVPTAATGGAYYEVALSATDAAGAAVGTYSFGCNSEGKLLIVGSSYDIVGESSLPVSLASLFDTSAQ